MLKKLKWWDYNIISNKTGLFDPETVAEFKEKYLKTYKNQIWQI